MVLWKPWRMTCCSGHQRWRISSEASRPLYNALKRRVTVCVAATSDCSSICGICERFAPVRIVWHPVAHACTTMNLEQQILLRSRADIA